MKKVTLFWFRRDLRLDDNHGLYRALHPGSTVLPLFIFDPAILDKLDDKDDPRISFIYGEISRLKRELESAGSSILVRYGKPEVVLREVITEYPVDSVYANHDYEPYAIRRDAAVRKLLESCGIPFHTFKDQVIFEKGEVVRDSGGPYTVFTPYSRKWRELYDREGTGHFPSDENKDQFYKTMPLEMLSQESMGFIKSCREFPGRDIDRQLLLNYHKTRDFPYLSGTSRLGVHLRFGTISIRNLAETASRVNPVFLNELIWREFYMMILWHFPHVVEGAFKPQYNRLAWRNDESEFTAWCEGNTGYPIVDAGMRELNMTGYMHNRLRMITASFLTKHLLIDWRWGESYFAKKLLDFELSSNNGGWQWAAGTGCDAAPYFRIFNPDLQAQKYDPQNLYIMKWVPEFNEKSYPGRIVQHSQARQSAMEAYKNAITG